MPRVMTSPPSPLSVMFLHDNAEETLQVKSKSETKLKMSDISQKPNERKVREEGEGEILIYVSSRFIG